MSKRPLEDETGEERSGKLQKLVVSQESDNNGGLLRVWDQQEESLLFSFLVKCHPHIFVDLKSFFSEESIRSLRQTCGRIATLPDLPSIQLLSLTIFLSSLRVKLVSPDWRLSTGVRIENERELTLFKSMISKGTSHNVLSRVERVEISPYIQIGGITCQWPFSDQISLYSDTIREMNIAGVTISVSYLPLLPAKLEKLTLTLAESQSTTISLPQPHIAPGFIYPGPDMLVTAGPILEDTLSTIRSCLKGGSLEYLNVTVSKKGYLRLSLAEPIQVIELPTDSSVKHFNLRACNILLPPTFPPNLKTLRIYGSDVIICSKVVDLPTDDIASKKESWKMETCFEHLTNIDLRCNTVRRLHTISQKNRTINGPTKIIGSQYNSPVVFFLTDDANLKLGQIAPKLDTLYMEISQIEDLISIDRYTDNRTDRTLYPSARRDFPIPPSVLHLTLKFRVDDYSSKPITPKSMHEWIEGSIPSGLESLSLIWDVPICLNEFSPHRKNLKSLKLFNMRFPDEDVLCDNGHASYIENLNEIFPSLKSLSFGYVLPNAISHNKRSTANKPRLDEPNVIDLFCIVPSSLEMLEIHIKGGNKPCQIILMGIPANVTRMSVYYETVLFSYDNYMYLDGSEEEEEDPYIEGITEEEQRPFHGKRVKICFPQYQTASIGKLESEDISFPYKEKNQGCVECITSHKCLHLSIFSDIDIDKEVLCEHAFVSKASKPSSKFIQFFS